MTRVTLAGTSDDGAQLLLTTGSGEHFTLAIDEDLRAAIRHARSVEHTATRDQDHGLSPRDIQQKIRAGLTAAELAELTGLPLEGIEKYEPPVKAEREYIAQLAQDTRIGRDAGSPVLGELVTDRLARRGIDPDGAAWDAWRVEGEPWKVAVSFPSDSRTLQAVWTFDHSSRVVTAEDDESRWLTETELLDVPVPRRHLAAVKPTSAAHDAPEATAQASLLDDLDHQRGVRVDVDVDDDEDETALRGSSHPAGTTFTARPAMPHPAGSGLRSPTAPNAPSDSSSPRTGEHPTHTPADGEARLGKKGRTSVPSWDEIVFGAKNDQH